MNEQQFFAQKPLNRVRYITVELYADGLDVRRFVRGQQFPLEFTLESDAPRNAGEAVEFEAAAFECPEPETGSGGAQEIELQLGAVGLQLKEAMKRVDLWQPIELIRRVYISGVEQPVSVIRTEAEGVTLDGDSAVIIGSQVNHLARSVARLYNTDDFPGLEVQL